MPVKIAHFRWIIEHYRAPILKRLSENPHLDFMVYAGDNREEFQGYRIATAVETEKNAGIRWTRIPSFWTTILIKFRRQPSAVGIALKNHFDIALIQMGLRTISGNLVRLICWIRGIPVIEWAPLRNDSAPLRKVQRVIMRRASVSLPFSDAERLDLIKRGFAEDRVLAVKNSLDHEAQIALRRTLTNEDRTSVRIEFRASGPDERLVFVSSRLDRRKDLGLLLRAIAELKSRKRAVRLAIIGDGEEEAALRRLTDDLGLEDRVFFPGACYDEECLGRIIFASDLCVVPREVGLVAIHSLVYGTPVLTCTNDRGMHGPEVEVVLEGVTGRFFKDGDWSDLSEKMEDMLYPYPCRDTMAAACREAVDREYTPEYQESIFIQAFNRCLAPDRRIPF